MKPSWITAAEYSGLDLDDSRIDLMQRFGRWLAEEGIRSGGLGPGERDRIDRRHLGDSILFASQFPENATTVWDLGSGVGLPGVPLAICRPDVEFVLIDRSGRRTDLLRRVIRILDLGNCRVEKTDLDRLTGTTEVMVSRASLSPSRLRRVADRHLEPGGVAVVAGSWRKRPDHAGWTTVEIPPFVLDQTVWLLIMRRQ